MTAPRATPSALLAAVRLEDLATTRRALDRAVAAAKPAIAATLRANAPRWQLGELSDAQAETIASHLALHHVRAACVNVLLEEHQVGKWIAAAHATVSARCGGGTPTAGAVLLEVHRTAVTSLEREDVEGVCAALGLPLADAASTSR
jgi:hypothetical protein